MSEINSIKLQSNLLLPTYLKNLSNIQIKLVWQNAAIELSEAMRIVFIGYSLPAADFEIRQLLARDDSSRCGDTSCSLSEYSERGGRSGALS